MDSCKTEKEGIKGFYRNVKCKKIIVDSNFWIFKN